MVNMEEPKEFPQLETDRLILRELTLKDVEFYLRHFNNEKIVEGCCFPGPMNLEAAREELERYCIRPFRKKQVFAGGSSEKEVMRQ